MAMNCGKESNLLCSSAMAMHDDPQIFRFVAQQIRCGHNWLSKNKLSMLVLTKRLCFVVRMANSPFFHSTNVNKYKQKI